MDKQYEYNGNKYWIRVEPAIHGETGETGFIAYISYINPEFSFLVNR
jgi:hypothetical protein